MCDFLVLIDAAGTFPIGVVDAKELIVLSRSERNRMLSICTGSDFDSGASGHAVPSTGMHAALALHAAGALVSYQGFSLAQGHALMPSAKRSHVENDAPIFRMLGILDQNTSV